MKATNRWSLSIAWIGFLVSATYLLTKVALLDSGQEFTSAFTILAGALAGAIPIIIINYIKSLRKKNKVMILHSFEDKVLADAIQKGLTSNGIIAYDEDDIAAPGDLISKKIEERLKFIDTLIILNPEKENRITQLTKTVNSAANSKKKILPIVSSDDFAKLPKHIAKYKPILMGDDFDVFISILSKNILSSL